jgi:glycosyltransferase involved in cell wall biosynthesis
VNVVIVADEVGFPRGFAASNYVRLLAKGIVSAGAHAHVVALDYSERTNPPLNTESSGQVDGVTFEYTTGSPILPKFPLAIPFGRVRSHARFLLQSRQSPADVILYYGRWPSELMATLAAAKLAHVPLLAIVVEWRLAFPNQTRFQTINDKLFCRAMKTLDGAIVLSRFLEDRVTPLLAKNAPCLQIPIFAEPEPWVGTKPAQRNKPYLVFCADLTGYYEDAVSVLRSVSRLGPRELELVFVGSATPDVERKLRQEARALADGTSLTLSTDYLPAEALRALYSGASALLAPLPNNDRSRARFPNKVGEYLLSGTPVVSHDVGEVGHWLRDGDSAFLANPNDPNGFTKSIARALDAPNAKAIGQKGRQIALDQFDYKVIGPKVVDFLEPLIARTR